MLRHTMTKSVVRARGFAQRHPKITATVIAAVVLHPRATR